MTRLVGMLVILLLTTMFGVEWANEPGRYFPEFAWKGSGLADLTMAAGVKLPPMPFCELLIQWSIHSAALHFTNHCTFPRLSYANLLQSQLVQG